MAETCGRSGSIGNEEPAVNELWTRRTDPQARKTNCHPKAFRSTMLTSARKYSPFIQTRKPDKLSPFRKDEKKYDEQEQECSFLCGFLRHRDDQRARPGAGAGGTRATQDTNRLTGWSDDGEA